MTFIKPSFRHPAANSNAIGCHRSEYEGALSTLCAGCGHDSIGSAVVQACFELSIPPHKLAKVSGIGCSSKTPTYFLGRSHGFNSVHGRMPSVTTGANLANRDLVYLGVSGDGDTASIGIGQFVHAVRRNINMLYIVMNNGCYGLTKGQDSATADLGSISKAEGSPCLFEGIDLVGLTMELGGTFAARSFSGDKAQLIPLIKAGLSHPGLAFIDCISPCVTFNNNRGSTKSYEYARDHIEAASMLDFVPTEEEIEIDYEAGTATTVTLHDGAAIRLRKLAEDWDPRDRARVRERLQQARTEGDILTGLLYIDPGSQDLHERMQTSLAPLNQLGEEALCPGPDALEAFNGRHR